MNEFFRAITERPVRFLVIVIMIEACVILLFVFYGTSMPTHVAPSIAAAAVASPFYYNFNVDGVLKETGSMNASASPFWWLNSGGMMFISNGEGKTIQGELPVSSPWRLAYAASNPSDTDNGFHPQNIFRLLTRSMWNNASQQAYFMITYSQQSMSPNRNASNGLLFFSRYKDSGDLYYAGIRVDGTAVIKKKVDGVYYTMAQSPLFPGTYDQTNEPNLLPKNTWLGLRMETETRADGTVALKLYVDKSATGAWILAAVADDDGKSFGGPVIAGPAYIGIRTDFMDVVFRDFTAAAITPGT